MARKPKYSGNSINIQEGAAGLRLNMGMYLGPQGDSMQKRIVDELGDNVYDEYIAGRAKTLLIYLDCDKNVGLVVDDAKGIPMQMKTLKSGAKISTLEAVFTMTHAGGKFDDSAYKSSSGTHGVGAAVANAASTKLKVWTRHKNAYMHQAYVEGESQAKPAKAKLPKLPINLAKYIKKPGTIVYFEPDQHIVALEAKRGKLPKKHTPAKFQIESFVGWLSGLAALNPGLRVEFIYKKDKKIKHHSYLNKKTAADYIKNRIKEDEVDVLTTKMLTMTSDSLDVVLTWAADIQGEYFDSYVNSKQTIDGGAHVKSMQDCIAKVLKKYATKNQKYKQQDLFLGLYGFINWRMNSAQFHSQVKDKLTSRIESDLAEIFTPVVEKFFNDNKTLARKIVKRATEVGKGRDELAKTAKNLAEVRKKMRSVMPECLVQADCKPELREIFIVEGDSAGGSAADSRNFNQEIFKMRGKIANALRMPMHKLLSNKVVQDLIVSLGVDLKNFDAKKDTPIFKVDKLRTKDVFMLCDADPDGYHIALLLTAFFYRFMPDLIREGRLHFVETPLYLCNDGKTWVGGFTAEEVLSKCPAKQKNTLIRAKGLGELNPDQLEIFAFNPETRWTHTLAWPDDKTDEHFYTQLVGESAKHRRIVLGLED